MEFDIIKEKILFWDTLISDRMKKYIHYKSMRNFILHFDEIRGDIVKVRIVALFTVAGACKLLLQLLIKGHPFNHILRLTFEKPWYDNGSGCAVCLTLVN